MITLDGFFEGPNGEIDWHRVDEEFNEFAIEQVNAADGILFGRVTYQMMERYWPTPSAIADDPIIAEKMNTIPKYVFSRTLETASWSNTTLLKGEPAAEIKQLKQAPGKDLLVFGSANLAASLIQCDCIDEYRIMVNPIIIGSGRPLFENVHESVALKLVKTRAFRNGNILLTYQPDR